MKNLFILLLSLFIFSCHDAATEGEPINKINSTNNQDSTEFYVNIIAKANQVHSEHVGYGGSKSEIFSAYEWMRNNMKIKEIFPLLKHDSTAVRVYAYKAIITKDSTMSARAWQNIKGKNDLVFTLSGCIGGCRTIESIIFRNPNF